MNRKAFLSSLFMTTVGLGSLQSLLNAPFFIPEKEIKNRLTKILKQTEGLKIDWLKFTWKEHLTKDLGMDDLDVVEFIMNIEKEFNILIPDEVAETLMTMSDVIAYLKKVLV